jgi:hypothetical protein
VREREREVRGISRESAVFFSIGFLLSSCLRLSLLTESKKRQKKKRDDGFFIFSSDEDERRHLSSALRFRGSVDDSFSSPSVLGRCEERTGFFFCSHFER